MVATEAGPSEVEGAPAGRVRTLTAADVPRLRLGWANRHDAADIRRLLASYPGRSVWSPDTREFALVGAWRHRDEVAAVHELSAVRDAEELVDALVARCRTHGAALVLTTELDERRRPAFYARLGFSALETVITYELERPSPDRTGVAPLEFVHVSGTEEEVAALLRIDHTAFPWLWWNSDPEFRSYLRTPGVEVHLGRLAGRPVAYVGITRYPGWGHLDRIAVDPAAQGQGLGARALRHAVATLAEGGARRIGLSTQTDNVRSQRLYERFGFHRSRGNDYLLYGNWLREPESGRRGVGESGAGAPS